MTEPWRRCRPARSGHGTRAADEVCRDRKGATRGPLCCLSPDREPSPRQCRRRLLSAFAAGRAVGYSGAVLETAAAHLGSEAGGSAGNSGDCGKRLRLTWARRAARPAWPCRPRRAGPTWRPGPRRTRPPGAAAHPSLLRSRRISARPRGRGARRSELTGAHQL